jgi:tripartite-type tricarboxylate transporter receptor subunit TctC
MAASAAGLIVAAAAGVSTTALAQEFPTRPITIIVP